MNKYNYSKSVKVARQNCPRSPSRDSAAGSELFQPLACPALVPVTHCENTLAHGCNSHCPQRKQRQTHHWRINCKHAKVCKCQQKITICRGRENQFMVKIMTTRNENVTPARKHHMHSLAASRNHLRYSCRSIGPANLILWWSLIESGIMWPNTLGECEYLIYDR